MTWNSARRDARLRFDLWSKTTGIPPAALKGKTVNLSLYADQETLDFLQPGNSWVLEYHAQVMCAFKRIVKGHSGDVHFVTITLAEYFEWLAKNDLENSPARRAQFITGIICPEPLKD